MSIFARKTRIRPNIKKIHSLSVWNPVSYIVLLYWVLCKPAHLIEYQRIFRDDMEQRIAGWLISHIIIFPLLFINLSLAMQWLPTSELAWSPKTYFIVTALLGISWLLLGLFASEPCIQDEPVFIGMYVLVVYSCFIATLGATIGLLLPMFFSLLLIIFLTISSGIALSIAGVMRFDFIDLMLEVIEAFANYAMKSSRKKMTSPSTLSGAIAEENIGNTFSGISNTMIVATLTFGAALLIATILTRHIDENIAQKTTSPITRYTFVISILSYSLVWIMLLAFLQ